jgi:hypothetical protein
LASSTASFRGGVAGAGPSARLDEDEEVAGAAEATGAGGVTDAAGILAEGTGGGGTTFGPSLAAGSFGEQAAAARATLAKAKQNPRRTRADFMARSVLPASADERNPWGNTV